jgi:hypothetical protein
MFFMTKLQRDPVMLKRVLLLYIHIKQLMQDQWKLSNVDKHMY